MYMRSSFLLFSLPVGYKMKSFLLFEFILDDKWKLKFIKSQSPFMLQGVNRSKSHQPLNVSIPLNISRVHPQLTGGHNIRHKIRFIYFKCLRESQEMQLLYNFFFRRSLRKNTLCSTQRTEINWFASRTSSRGRYWICYNIPVNVM